MFLGRHHVACASTLHVLDTNVFNDALKGKISSAAFADRRLLVTDVQAAELRATKETTKQAASRQVRGNRANPGAWVQAGN
jgi:hypothetical protein